MKPANRRSGYWNREKETVAGAAREWHQSRCLGRLLDLDAYHADKYEVTNEPVGKVPHSRRS